MWRAAVFVQVTFALVALVPRTAAAEDAADKKLGATQSTEATSALKQLVRDVLQHEITAQADDKSLWCYRKLLDKDGKVQLFATCQTEGAEINRLMAVNGQPLNAEQKRVEQERIEKSLMNGDLLKKRSQQEKDDAKQSTNMLKLIPDAFVFQQESKDGDRLNLSFAPDPNFRPSGFSSQVLHHMEGTLKLDLRQRRLVEISGKLDSEVKFVGGLLGHLDKGGAFFVKQREVGPGCWEMTTLDVQMNGKALLFKTISVRTKEIDTDFHAVSPASSIQQVAALTNESGDKSVGRAQR
jgi:hypothetical protein